MPAMQELQFLWKHWGYILTALLVAGFFLPVRLHLQLYREPNNLLLQSILVIGIIPVRFRLVNPLTRFFWTMSRNKFWRKEPPRDLAAREVPWKRFLYRSTRVKKLTYRVWLGANRLFSRLGKPIRIKELVMYTEIGVGDAALTGLSAGLAWIGLGLVVGRLSGIFNMQGSQNRLQVVPNYRQDNFLLINYRCIFEFRLGHIIIVIYQLLKSAVQIGKLIRRVSQ